jgi:hypothetical protein
MRAKKQGNSKQPDLVAENLRFAKSVISQSLSRVLLDQLREITRDFKLSLRCGDLLLLSGGWYVTHTGLIRLARRSRCSGIQVQPVRQLSDQASNRYTFRATVYKSARCRGFVGYGDADPNNVSSRVHGAELRVAETRAVNRALRKAYGIGICSVDELGNPSNSVESAPPQSEKLPPQSTNGNGGPRVRDRLCQIIRQHKLDPELVKSYATDFCGVKTLREATREQVESFVQQLADWAEKDRNALLCQLNSYMRPKQEGAA